jgi:hypothetical protein
MRILGIGVLAALVSGAFGAGSALAAKDPYTVDTHGQFAHCPYQNTELTDCFFGRTAGGKSGGFFRYGSVEVKLNKPIVIQGGFKGEGAAIEVMAPTDGAKLLESPAEPIVKGLKVITPKIQQEAEWPEALKQSFKEALRNGEGKASVVIESAGDECTTVPGCLDTESLLTETKEPPAFKLALKARVVNSWLEKLGGGPCLIGSDEHPIKQNLNTAGVGRPAESITFNEEFTILFVKNTGLTDDGWTISPEQGATGCGGEYEEYVNKALNRALAVGFPKKSGFTLLEGDLFDGSAEAIRFYHEQGDPELP